jgi:hypothetical protein
MGACAKCGDYYSKLHLFSVPKFFEYKIRQFQRKSNWRTSAGNLVLMFNGYQVCERCLKEIQADMYTAFSRMDNILFRRYLKGRNLLGELAAFFGLLSERQVGEPPPPD